MVLAVEPMVTAGRHAVRVADDHWSIFSQDGSLAAHFEFTIAITADGPRVLTPWHEAGERAAPWLRRLSPSRPPGGSAEAPANIPRCACSATVCRCVAPLRRGSGDLQRSPEPGRGSTRNFVREF